MGPCYVKDNLWNRGLGTFSDRKSVNLNSSSSKYNPEIHLQCKVRYKDKRVAEDECNDASKTIDSVQSPDNGTISEVETGAGDNQQVDKSNTKKAKDNREIIQIHVQRTTNKTARFFERGKPK